MSDQIDRQCVAGTLASPCHNPVEADAPLSLCPHHFLVAHNWVEREVGVTDRLPSPCVACGSRLGVRYPSGWLCAICEWKVGDTPDEPGDAPRVDIVYYIRFGERIKIGTSANPRSRLSTLVHDELLAFERGGREREQKRHRQFADYRLARTEWFAVNDTLLEHIRLLREGVDDPWSQYHLWVSEQRGLRG